MRIFIIILLSLTATCSLYAQTLKKYKIGNSGCSALFLCNPGAFNVDKSDDSSDVYTGECTAGDMTYGIICVKLKNKITDTSASESTLTAYLDYLKTSLNITSATGYKKGHRLKNMQDTRGITDGWKDNEGSYWKIAGWTNGAFITVLYINNKKEMPGTKTDAFLNGLSLPGK